MTLAPIFENIPQEITHDSMKQWVLWKLEVPYWALQAGRSDILAKVPKRLTGNNAKPNDPGTWTRYANAKEAFARSPDRFSGVGFVVTKAAGIVCVDLDKVRNRDTGEILPEAMELIRSLASYAEVSPSETGVKVWVRGTLPDDCPCSLKGYFGPGTALELFDDERYTCVTGHILAEAPATIEESQTSLDVVAKKAIDYKAAEQAKKNAGRAHRPFVARDPSTVTENERIRRAQQYLAKVDPAISGQKGHCQTLWAARVLVWGFEVDPDTAFSILAGEWNTRCVPPWCERDLWRKISEADIPTFNYPRGWLLARGQMPQVGPRPMAWNGPSRTPEEAPFAPSAEQRTTEEEEACEPKEAADGECEYDSSEWEPVEGEDVEEQNEAAPESSTSQQQQEMPDVDVVLSGDRVEKVGEHSEEWIPLGGEDPESHRVVLSPNKTLPSVDAFRRRYFRHEHGWTIANQGGYFCTWEGNRYVQMDDDAVRKPIIRFLHEALRYTYDKKVGLKLVPFEANPGTTEAVFKTLRMESAIPASLMAPMWINGGQGPDPRNLLAFPSGTLDITSGQVYAPTPLLFNFNAIDFEYDPKAPTPERWLYFLNELWPNDPDSIQLLQEMFGYLLTGDTSLQKAFYIIGPRRSGKGTIGRILRFLIGKVNVCNPSTGSLNEKFGLAQLVGKSVAIVSDARFHGDIGVAVERLLNITGEDPVTVEAKYKGEVSMKLPLRFLFLGNDAPKFNDSSNALVGRFHILRIVQTFYGREDTTLTRKLQEELPGILLWAIRGANRLRNRGEFIQPESGKCIIEQMEDMSSTVGPFVHEHCEIGDAGDERFRVTKKVIYEHFSRWCERIGRRSIPDLNVFSRDLISAFPGVHPCRNPGASLEERHFYKGIRLSEAVAPW